MRPNGSLVLFSIGFETDLIIMGATSEIL